MRREQHIRRLSLYLVLAQFGSLFYILITGPLFPEMFVLQCLELLAIGIGSIALLNMGIGNVSINPIPKDDAKLEIRFLYKYIRHPMYLGLMILCGVLVFSYLTPIRIFVFIFLIISLWAKMTIEENMLLRKFPEYAEHLKKSWRLIPFIY